MSFNVAVAGDDHAPPVLLLHGFPESWRSWTRQIGPLSEAGLRIHAADMPGYGGTDEPPAYDLLTLAGCVSELCRAIDERGVHLVGHDWGGIVGNVVAARHPDVVRSFVAICGPHPDAFQEVWRDPLQLVRAWYVVALQIPGIERVLGSSFFVDRVFAGSSSGVEDPETFRRAIAYYRANLRPWQLRRDPIGRIPQPGLVIHATGDAYVREHLMEATAELFDDLRGFHRIDAGHFVQRRSPDELNRLLLELWRELEVL